jgi:phospholipid/cholesterol/gamma-HCH transport system substrate-binding protein
MSQPNPNQGEQVLLRQSVKGRPVEPPSPWERSKGKVYALILIALMLGIAGLSAAAYNKAFDGSVPITLKADRAGLQMQAGNRVKIRGVDLGRVDEVKLSEDQKGVDITLAVKPELLKQIPDNATVSLEQLSAFGNKAVQMNYPAQPSGKFLAEGSVIDTSHISVEVNSTFDSLTTLLNRIQPSKLNSVLGGLANTFEGNGDTLGADFTQLNAYLKKFNGDLPALQRDWRSAGAFADVYAGAGNDIVDTLKNASVITNTLDERRENFERVLEQTGAAGDELSDFFGENAVPLTKMLRSLRPFTSLLDEYAPVITCFIDGAGVAYDGLAAKGFTEAGADFEVNVVEPGGTEQYKYPRDLPRVGPGWEKGPNCRGLPVVTNSEDSLADYTPDPPSLNQRTVDNSPRVAPSVLSQLDVNQPIPNIPPLPVSLKKSLLAKSSTAYPPLVQFFGPQALYSPEQLKKMKKAGK